MNSKGKVLLCAAVCVLFGVICFVIGRNAGQQNAVTVYESVSILSSEDEASEESADEASQNETAEASSAEVSSEEASAEAVVTDELWDLNSATVEQLLTIEGMTTSTAEKILEFRELSGGFTRIEEVRNVSGVSQNLANRIAERFTVE